MTRTAWSVPVIWPDATVVVIGTGPSLTLSQLHLVARARLAERCHVIVVNDAVFVAWWADWLHACDYKWWAWHRDTAPKFPGIRTTCIETVPESWARYLKVIIPNTEGDRGGFAEDPDTVAGGGNGGYQAIQLAVKAGGHKVLLLGLDMKLADDGNPHYHGDHPDQTRSDYKNTMLPHFPGLAKDPKRLNVEVLNCSPGSAIDCFPRVPIEEALCTMV